ncbi:MAG: N-acetylneuraminate synthase [Elusimicrobia bacterium CG1_02_63_36]|nr:MAG: N-acetylneuraminate synthase [Elusimicrobia bacterium CG1_02_63_36]PIP83012.1 MAG: N-acetylneuraminate synthase [Elusimicrobia bacterium CG22_combo_CG10-13_8_21_14_all_63_91]PJA17505.1 MAG: N-acetylneuraminate synthase [Elusimicrobia bacterium CG_4_10_14_0_2_um_filter_63_34]PJB25423.1 MAG: N-acetylneuraminate synthase [Elusimicrobia bacterium CG_4_9_14_3_um_filter_62_55]
MKNSETQILIIAEAGVNHNGDLSTAERLVAAAVEAGADAVKFQTFDPDALAVEGADKAAYQKETTAPDESQREMLRRLRLSDKDHEALRDRCREAGVEFLSSPFDERSADMLEALGVSRLKLGSGELTNKPLLEHVARKKLPLLLSTGMSTLGEVAEAVTWYHEAGGSELTLLHCVSQYPAPPEQTNLRAMDALRDRFGLPVGFSDHSTGLAIPIAAAARGARVIEKHFTLDKTLPGPDHRASIEPADFAAMVRGIREVESALGDGVKQPAPCEADTRIAARKSLVAARPLTAGRKLARTDIAVKRPGTGAPPKDLEQFLGRELKRDLETDAPLRLEDI